MAKNQVVYLKYLFGRPICRLFDSATLGGGTAPLPQLIPWARVTKAVSRQGEAICTATPTVYATASCAF